MLREPTATRRRRIAGNAAVAILASAAAFAAWASQPQDAASNGSKSAASDVVGTIKINPSDFPVGEVRIPPPAYPKDSVDAGSGGTIMLLIDVAADGSITGVSVESATTSDRRLVAAAAKNAWDWKFTPQVKDGKPVAGRVRVPVTFSPAEPKASAQG